jgi:hypothetical protein
MNFTSILTIAVIVVVFIILFKVFKLVMRLLLVVVFLALAYATNPELEQHKKAVYEKAKANHLRTIGKKIEADDFYVFSLTYSQGLSERNVIGAGAFTQVFIFRNP